MRSPLPTTTTTTTAAALVIAALGGCSPLPDSQGARSPTPPASPAPTVAAPESTADVTFTDGASLGPNVDISWGDGLVADDGWQALPSDHPGRWSYANVAGTCTAAFRGGILGDASGMDDREATDALIEYQSGEDFPGQDLLADGYFLRHGHDGSGVAHRQFAYTVDDLGYFMAARAFVQADYSVSVIVTCHEEPVGPVAQEVLSKNFIDVDESAH